jgi:acetyl esterase/lipase
VLGGKRGQGLPLMLHMARRGWICVSATYRLSPAATFPDHLLDAKRALVWIREHGAEYGADPSFVAVTGGSAGGHLAALLALTANQPALQPGCERVDTRVQACVPVYGVFDLSRRIHPIEGAMFRRLVDGMLMKTTPERSPDAFARASPAALVHPEAPPFLIVQGELDSMVPAGHARDFHAVLRATSRAPVALAIVPHAQHAFDVFPSLRTQEVVHGVARFLDAVRATPRPRNTQRVD